jgi:hypothetical protein
VSVRLKSRRPSRVTKDKRHFVSINTGKLSELSREHVVRCTEINVSFFNTMSRTSGVAEELFGRVVGVSDTYIKQEFSLA